MGETELIESGGKWARTEVKFAGRMGTGVLAVRCKSSACKWTHCNGRIVEDAAVYWKLTAEVRHFIHESLDNVRRPQTACESPDKQTVLPWQQHPYPDCVRLFRGAAAAIFAAIIG